MPAAARILAILSLRFDRCTECPFNFKFPRRQGALAAL
jgi:hypothetical protein